MPKLSEVIGGSRDCVATVNDVKIEITYDPNEYTPEAEAIWEEYQGKGTAGALAVDFLCRLLKDWDLEENDSDDIVAITPERLKTMSLIVLSGVMDGIFQDVGGDGASPKPNREQRRRLEKSRKKAG